MEYSPRITEIGETSGVEAADGKAIYVNRKDGGKEFISSVWDFTGYSMHYGESLLLREFHEDFWEAYNTIAKWILKGRIRLSGGRDCFKRPVIPEPGVGTLGAGQGILFIPHTNQKAFGKICSSAPDQKFAEVHLTLPRNDDRGRPTNSIILLEGTRYLIAGDRSGPSLPDRAYPEIMICHRGRLREAGFEVPGFICKDDFWILDSAGKRLGTFPLEGRVTCTGCRQSYANTEWPTPDVCEGKGHCDNVHNEMGSQAKEKGYRPALAEVECARYVLCTYRGGRIIHSIKVIRNIARVLDASFTIRNWEHLAEVTGYQRELLALYFCTVPSLGERLSKKGASFVGS